MTPAERLAALLPLGAIEDLARVLPVDHAGVTVLELGHDPAGKVLHWKVTPAARTGRVRRGDAEGARGTLTSGVD